MWSLAGAAFLVWADRRWKLDHGRLFTLYVAVYTSGRFWVERLRIDPAHHVGQWRLNDVTALVVLTGAVVILIILQRRHGKDDGHSDRPAAQAK